jgi:hypothetical protein
MGRPFCGARGRAHLWNHFQVLLDVLPPVDDATAGERLFRLRRSHTMSARRQTMRSGTRIQDRMRGSGTAHVSFATETASSLVRKLNVYTPSELPPPLTLFHLAELKISSGRSPPRAKTVRRR